MPSIITPRDDGNWVDRGEPDFPKLVVALRHFFGPERGIPDARLEDAAREIQGVVGGHAITPKELEAWRLERNETERSRGDDP